MRRHRTLPALLALVALVAAACGDDDAAGEQASDDRPLVVTTVSPITSISSDVIGDNAVVRGVVPEGADSHTFEPPPSVSEVLEQADVVFLNGLGLEQPTLELAEDLASDAEIVLLGDLVLAPDDYVYDSSFPEEGGTPNPHLWTDPTLAKEYARSIAETMVEVDPDHADEYRANLAAFEDVVDDFDAVLRAALETVPEENRKLVTYHDAYAYWAETYGWEVVAAVQPEDFGDPSPQAVAELIDQIREEQVPAVFGSEVFPSPVLETIAAETGADYVADLRDDDLPGAPGDEEHSWLGLLRENYVAIVQALGGDPAGLDEFFIEGALEDPAEYPQ